MYSDTGNMNVHWFDQSEERNLLHYIKTLESIYNI